METELPKNGTHGPVNNQSRLTQQPGSIRFAADSDTPEEDDLLFESVSATASDWLPEVLRESIPWMVDATRRVAKVHYPRAITAQRDGVLANHLASYGVTAVTGSVDYAGEYALAAAELLTHTIDVPTEDWGIHFETSSRVSQSPIHTLVNISYSHDGSGDSFAPIRDGPAALAMLCDHPTRVWLNLESNSWMNTRRSQRETALNAITSLARGFEILLVASPETKEFLETKHPRWCEEHLTQSNNPPYLAPPRGVADHPDNSRASVADTLQKLSKPGYRSLIHALPSETGESRTIQELKDDANVDLAESTIDRYYRELETLGILTVKEPRGSNQVSLTRTGRAAKERLGHDGQFRHPLQQDLTEASTPPQLPASIVCQGRDPVDYSQSQCFDKVLTANTRIFGQPRTAPQPLPLSGCTLSKSEQFARLSTVHQTDGLTLVDDHIPEFVDGRIVHLGEFDGEIHLITEWGGALPTLVRIASTLLSQFAFDNILTKPRLKPVLDNPVSEDVLRLGRQIGWIKKAEYSHIKQALSKNSNALIPQIRGAKYDKKSWISVASNAHGLIASATALYDAIDLDVCIQIRVPDTAELQRDNYRYQSLIEFFSHTIPKQALYHGNSAQRHLLETDGDKLKYRLPTQIDPTNNQAELTASWALVGPDVGEFLEDIASELESLHVREQVASGSETGIEVPIELYRTDSLDAVIGTIELMLDTCGRELCSTIDTVAVAKVCCYALSHPREERYPSLFDVAEVFLHANRLAPEGAPLGIEHICGGLGWLDDERVYPWLPVSASKMSAALFRAPNSLQRKEILNKAEISTSSYERYRSDLDDLGLLVNTGNYQYEPVVPGQHKMTDDFELSWFFKPHVEQCIELSGWLRDVFRHRHSPSSKTVTIG